MKKHRLLTLATILVHLIIAGDGYSQTTEQVREERLKGFRRSIEEGLQKAPNFDPSILDQTGKSYENVPTREEIKANEARGEARGEELRREIGDSYRPPERVMQESKRIVEEINPESASGQAVVTEEDYELVEKADALAKKERQRIVEKAVADTPGGESCPSCGKVPDVVPGLDPPVADGPFLKKTERLYLLFSSSVPQHTLSAYADDIERLRDTNLRMVMRGFVGGMKKMEPTDEFLLQFLQVDPDCDMMSPGAPPCETKGVVVLIDPMIFRRYGVEKAPALVYVPHIEKLDNSPGEGTALGAKVTGARVIYGDANLAYLVKGINHDKKYPSLAKIAKFLERDSEEKK